jgi:LysR family carnitine catabolism transcriptional activator
VQNNCGIALLPESSFDYTSQLGISKTTLHGALSRSVGMFTPRDLPPKALVQLALSELLALEKDRIV